MRAAGFTLVELLVVLTLIGLASSAVLLTLPDDDDTAFRQADALGLSLQRARDEAVLTGRGVQVSVDASGYRFSRQDFQRWQPLDAAPLVARTWSGGVHAVMPDRQAQVGFRFDPTGAAERQSVTLVHGKTQVRVAVDVAGEVEIHGTAR